MKERPILMSAPMVRAILDGSKTQTRRVVKPQPLVTDIKAEWAGRRPKGDGGGGFAHFPRKGETPSLDYMLFNCPYGQPGDRLWVRETFADLRGAGFDRAFAYLADSSKKGYEDEESKRCRLDYGVKWKPSIHMPRIASRLTLEITGVRVERLQDISEAHAIAEGIYQDIGGKYQKAKGSGPFCNTARQAFQFLWEDINGAESWAANPWIWVVEFKRVGK